METNGRSGPEDLQIDKGRLESLAELVALWRRNAEDYSREFLAATILMDLGRRRRVIFGSEGGDNLFDTANETQIVEAVELLTRDRQLGEAALRYSYAWKMLEDVKRFSDSFRKHLLSDESLADTGMQLLFDYDSLDLMLGVLQEAPLSSVRKRKLSNEKSILSQMEKLIRRNRMAFYAASPMVSQYCAAWNVQEGSPLQNVANLSGEEAELIWSQVSPSPAILPEAMPDCPDEEQIVLAFQGKLPVKEMEVFKQHYKTCAHCKGILNLLTASYVQEPEKLEDAPVEALPPRFRKPAGEKVAFSGHKAKTLNLIVRPLVSLPLAARGERHGIERLDELSRRQVIIEAQSGQVVLFVRGGDLCLSSFADKPRVVSGLRITVIGKRKPVVLRKARQKSGEMLYVVGSVSEFFGRTLVISFRFGARSIRQPVRITGMKSSA